MDRLNDSSFYRAGMLVILTLTLFACSGGGGCSGCEGCGISPIRGGYSLDDRISNSAQVRLTSGGIEFIENNMTSIVGMLMPGGLDFAIPRTETSTSVIGSTIDITVCPDGDCAAHIEIESVDIVPTSPNRLAVLLRAIVDTRDASGGRRAIPIRMRGGCSFLGCLVNTTCQADIDTRRGSRTYIGMVADIDFNEETREARIGYTRVDIGSAALADGEDIEDDDIEFGSCSGISGALINFVSGFIKGTLVDQLQDQVSGLLDSALGDQLCQTRGDFGCPTGTYAVPDEDPGSTCRFGPAEGDDCVPILLGTDGEGDLGGTLLGGFSPGTHAYAQFLLASGGQGEAVNEGMSLFFYGGFRGTDRTFTTTPAHHSCVPTIEPPPLPEINRTEAFRGNVIPGTATPAHVGIGIAEDYMNYAGYGLFDSGMLCLGAGTRLSQQLSTGLVSAAIMSLPDLTFPDANSPLTIAIRPQTPPVFTVGAGTEGDPLLQIALNTLQLDFYVWSSERYVRFMTFQTDLQIGIDLTVESNQIVPTIRGITATNSSVTNNELLAERPEALAATLQAVIQSFAGSFTSGISPFDLPDIMGFELEVPAGGITRVTEAGENFLGIFANLRIAPPAPIHARVDTILELSDLTLDRESMHPEHWNEGEGNSVWLNLRADGPLGVDYEYSYRIDGGPWSRWTSEPRVRVEDEVLLLQARHEIEARARVAGEAGSTDETPARAELLVDILPPRVQIARTADGVEVRADDVISAREDLEVRYLVGGTWTEWGSAFRLELAFDSDDVAVEVRDEAGNVGRSQAPLIRGLPNPGGSGGCGCSAPGGSSGGMPLTLLGLLGVLGAVVIRRRRGGRRTFFLSAVVLSSSLLAAGCDCGGTVTPPLPCNDECRHARPPGVMTGSICCEASDECAPYDLDTLCEPGYECDEDDIVADASCGVTCSACTVKPALQPGILATHLDAVVDDAGSVTISGYSPGVANGRDSVDYGDLVFGTWNGTGVDWEIIDGAPSSPITNDPAGWRGGVSAPGPDVGRWTSQARRGEDHLISYYDVTNGSLRLAVGRPGSWQTHTVDDTGDSGRYSSLVVTPEGVPMIAYLRIQESTDAPGQIESSVMVATANLASPSGPADWTLTEVVTGPMACRPAFCDSAPSCLESGVCVTPTSDCTDSCASPDVCFNGSCTAALPINYVEDMPPALGLYTSLAIDPTGGLALVYYDRSAGNVHGVRYDGAAWGTPFLIDGYARAEADVGDSGQSADVVVDSAGVWHVAYIDGAEETLRYAQAQSDGNVLSREVVDDGGTIDGTTRHTDGRHIVGDDASIAVFEGGAVRIAYQDATVQNAVVASRGGGGGPWTIAHVDTEGSTGYWVDQELLGSTSYLVMWWRARDGRSSSNGIRVVIEE